MTDESDSSTSPPPLQRREVFRTVRGARLSASRGRPAHQLQHQAEAPTEAVEVFAKRPYSEPND